MSPVNLHPEALLDRLDTEELSESEQRTLNDHLKQCPTCRFQLQVRADFESEALDLEALEAHATKITPTPLHEQSAVATSSAPRRRFAVLLTAAALVTASGAAALMSVAAFAPPTSPERQVTASEAAPAPRAPTPKAPARPTQVSPNKLTSNSVANTVHYEAAVRQAPQPARTERKSSASGQPKRAPGNPAPAAMRDGAAELFSVANQARRASRFAEAKRLYHRLQEQFPGSSEAQLSLLTLASLQLDTGNAGAALRMFDRYLRRAGGPLEAEALYGRARALRRLNQGNAEARAWRGLLAKYPGSRYAHEAQERLKALSVD